MVLLRVLAGDTTTTHVRFACSHCGQVGEIVWNGEGDARELVRLSEGFHIEEGRLAEVRYLIVCDVCDEIDPLGEGGAKEAT